MKKRRGFVLAGVVIILLFLLIVVPVMVRWVQDDTKISVKDQKSGMAFNLAEAAVERGYWKVKSSTGTFADVSLGTALSGYNFDATYADIPGGSYRVKIVSGPDLDQITIYGEGRDSGNKETRAIKAIYTNTSVPGAILSAGKLSANDADSVVHWGPIMAKGNIELVTGYPHYPRKLSMQTVKPLDTTDDTNPPNTDSLEWWSNYNVPDLPIFDFVTMRSSAAATNTLNCQDVYTTYSSYISTTYAPSPASCTYVKSGATKTCTCTCGTSGTPSCVGKCSCGCNATYTTMFTTHTLTTPVMRCCNAAVGSDTCNYTGKGNEPICTNCTLSDIYLQTAFRDKDYTWFWDNNATWGGYTGVRGTIIVKGDLSVNTAGYDDRYCRSATDLTTMSLPANPGCTVPVPPNAWREYQKFDTVAADEYPGDLGLRSSALTYKIGTSHTESSGSGGDLGVYGFLYVGGDFARAGASDVYGSMWVVGDVSGTGNTMVFYNSKLKLPTLNVVLTKESWQEQQPSAQAWP